MGHRLRLSRCPKPIDRESMHYIVTLIDFDTKAQGVTRTYSRDTYSCLGDALSEFGRRMHGEYPAPPATLVSLALQAGMDLATTGAATQMLDFAGDVNRLIEIVEVPTCN